MLTLDATAASLEIVLSGAITTNQLPIVASWADKTTSTFTPGKTTSATNNTSTVTIVAAPAASTQREVHSINIYNADTAAAIITVRENDNSTLRTLVKITLAVGDTLTYTHAEGWKVTDTNGQIKNVAGLVVLTSQVSGILPVANGGTGIAAIPYAMTAFTATGTFTTPSNSSVTTVYRYRLLGAGGGGGGSVTTTSAGGGAGAGALAEGTFTGIAPSTGIAVTIGAGGVGGTSGVTGSTGGSSSLGTPVTITCTGGVGGAGSNATGGDGGVGGTVSVGSPQISQTGATGARGYTDGLSNGFVAGGYGAGTCFGSGGIGGSTNISGPGSAGIAYGSGGGGGVATTAMGGAGANGICEIERMTP